MELTFWRDLSIVLLVLEAFILMLVPGVILFFSIKGIQALQNKLREYAPKVQGVFHQVDRTSRKVSDKVAAPFIAVSAARAQVKGLQRGAASLFKRHEVIG